ncbi:MFS transporter [Falsarthrobacter nasiphocae]|uniref:MFS family permease n=1 Tax=Falsarthrobacter nasiphocae TaxID=189863 RepID=A0AAE3YGP1_9MICC|nr:MFS transporter [Falsarthrobacter nasiphocae]MDR6891466.1 MFS family permease [Falsarthrobacter nasiphocae]
MPLPRALRPFTVPAYRWLVASMTLSVFAAGMWVVTLAYEVIDLGGGPSALSFVASISAVVLVALALPGGILADRTDRKRILVTVEALNAVAMAVTSAAALLGVLQLWHLAVSAALLSVSVAFYFPAYSAILPRLLPPGHLLAANGIEGMVRPAFLNALGPAAAGALIGAFSPHAGVFACLLLFGAATATALGLPAGAGAVARDAAAEPTTALQDFVEGARFARDTPWFGWTLVWACCVVLVFIGPIEVLLPFLVREQLGGGASMFALMLASMGAGSVLGSWLTASRPLPRRYLTTMLGLWGVIGLIPMALLPVAGSPWTMGAVMAILGASGSAGQVIWGTLLQRRVPPELLGRASSLDFFVSLALMPLSMAIAGPLGERFGLTPLFVAPAVVGPILSLAVWTKARLWEDEVAHPLTDHEDLEPVPVD